MTRSPLFIDYLLLGGPKPPPPANLFDLEKVRMTEISPQTLDMIFRHNFNTDEIVKKALAVGRSGDVISIFVEHGHSSTCDYEAIFIAIDAVDPALALTAFQALADKLVRGRHHWDHLEDYQQHLNPLDHPARLIYFLEKQGFKPDVVSRLREILAKTNLPQEPVIPKRPY